MGMFDCIMLEVECPYCKEISMMEAQTKDLECILERWGVGDYITDRVNYLFCTVGCVAPKCKKYVTEKHGYFGGFGRIFDIKVILESGIVTGDYEIVQKDFEP